MDVLAGDLSEPDEPEVLVGVAGGVAGQPAVLAIEETDLPVAVVQLSEQGQGLLQAVGLDAFLELAQGLPFQLGEDLAVAVELQVAGDGWGPGQASGPLGGCLLYTSPSPRD